MESNHPPREHQIFPPHSPIVERHSVEIEISEATQVGQTRRMAISMAEDLGFDENCVSRISIVTNELATNILKHAKKGRFILNRDRHGLELIAMDRGPGIANLTLCMKDGYSTAGTNGTGLGAVSRMADESDFYSTPEHGTIAFARFGKITDPTHLRVGGVCLPIAGETECGDGWQADISESHARIAIVDGLGHGPAAAKAAAKALQIFEENRERSPSALLQACHAGMRSTRGAAMGVARLDFGANVVTYAGVGNTVGFTYRHQETKRMISYEGTLGLQARKLQELTYPFERPSLLVFHTDGISTSWSLDKYPGIAYRHPSIISALILRDHARGRDDATVVTFSWKAES
jgi:anti-sigma regulatory factor (Ser/Thr protein kinase)